VAIEDAADFTVSLNDKVSAGASSASKSLLAMEKAAKQPRDELGRFTKAADGAGFSLGGIGGVAGVAGGAFVAMSTAVGATLFKLGEFTAQATEAQEAAMALAEAEYGNTAAAKAVVDAQYAVSASSALSQDKVFALAQNLEKAGVSAGAFKDYLQAMSETASVAGDAATKPIEKVIKKVEQLGKFQIKETDLKGSGIKISEVYEELAQKMGKSTQQIALDIKSGKIAAEEGLDAITEVMHNKFGEAAGAKALGIGTQIEKAKENFVNLFKDVDTSPLKSGLHEIFSLLDGNTKTGKALKSVLTGAMTGLFKAAAATIPYVEAFLLGVGIAGLDVYIAMKPAIKAIEKALGFDGKTTTNSMKTASDAGRALGFVVGSLVVGMAAIWAAGAFAFKGILIGVNAVRSAWPKMVAGVKSVYTSIKSGLSKAVDYVKGLPADFTAAGDAMIDGLVQAIQNGASKVVSAVTGVMSGAVKAGKAAIGMASPAKRFGEMGDASIAGYTGAVSKGHDKIQASVKHVLSFSTKAANDNGKSWAQAGAEKRFAEGSGSSGGVTVEAGAFVINIYAKDGDQAKDIAIEVERTVAQLLAKLRAASAA